MARIEAIEHRLRNWANWKLGARGSYAGVQLGETPMPRDPYADAPIPVSNVEASETDAAVQRLPAELARTVEVFYLAACNELKKAALLCIARTTMHERIDRAHKLLARDFTDRQQRARAERVRVEALQAGMRPC